MQVELTIGEVAARAGVAASAIRHYETMGLISSERTKGNQRRFARSALRRIAGNPSCTACGHLPR